MKKIVLLVIIIAGFKTFVNAAVLNDDFQSYNIGTLEDQSFYINNSTDAASTVIVDPLNLSNKIVSHDCTDSQYRSIKTPLYYLGDLYEDVVVDLDFYLASDGATTGVLSVIYVWEMDSSANRPMQIVLMADGDVQANSGTGWQVTGAGTLSRDTWYHIHAVIRNTYDGRTAHDYIITEKATGDVIVKVAVADSYGAPWGVKSAQIRTYTGFKAYYDNFSIKPAKRPAGPFIDNFESYSTSIPFEDQSIFFTNMDATSLVNKAQIVNLSGNKVLLQDATIGAARTTKLAANYLKSMFHEVEFNVDLRLDAGQTTIYVWEVDGGANNNRPLQIVVNSSADGGVWVYGDTVGGEPVGGYYWIGDPGVIQVGSGKWYRFKGYLHLSQEGALSTVDLEIIDIAANTIVAGRTGIDAKGWPMDIRSFQFRTEAGGVAYFDNIVLKQLYADCQEAISAGAVSVADINSDCVVNLVDLARMAENWLESIL